MYLEKVIEFSSLININKIIIEFSYNLYFELCP